MRERIITTLSYSYLYHYKEADLQGPNEIAMEAFKWHLQPGIGLNHDNLQQVLMAQTKVREINEACDQNQHAPAASKDDEEGPQVKGDTC